jgi:hypothetical protein
MDIIFEIVANILYGISQITGLTYNEVNIIVYYIIIPLSWIILLDKILKFNYLKIGFCLIIICLFFFIKGFSKFSDWLFNKSVEFLLFWGDYTIASVVICVFLVVFVYVVLIYFAFFHKKINILRI